MKRTLWIGIGIVGGIGALSLLSLINGGGSSNEPAHPIERVGVKWLKNPGTEAGYVGNEECRSCHPAEFEAHAGSPHARTVARIPPGELRAEFTRNSQVFDEIHGVAYTTLLSAQGGELVAQSDAGQQRTQPNWVFGSGTNAWTYMRQEGNRFTELRLTYFPRAELWNFTPGQGPQNPYHSPLGQVYSAVGAASCFGCHGTVVVGTRETGIDFDRSRLNVGCESCHGPGKAHVESARQLGANGGVPAVLMRPAKPTGEDEIGACGACHRLPVDTPAGDPLLEQQLARFAGPALLRSKCYTESQGRLTCTTCHDPHKPASRDLKWYDSRCGSCHQGTQENPACKLGKTSNCTPCHMPKESIARKLPLAFHNHWIRRKPAGAQDAGY